MIDSSDQKVGKNGRPKVVRTATTRYAIPMNPQYLVWRDRADNLGIQCLLCNKTFWTGFESIIDPTTGQPCSNCQLITSQNVLQTENQSYQPDGNNPDAYPLSQPVQTDGKGNVTV